VAGTCTQQWRCSSQATGKEKCSGEGYDGTRDCQDRRRVDRTYRAMAKARWRKLLDDSPTLLFIFASGPRPPGPFQILTARRNIFPTEASSFVLPSDSGTNQSGCD
jgi:hypothetical protein